jgi:hypothetical protein
MTLSAVTAPTIPTRFSGVRGVRGEGCEGVRGVRGGARGARGCAGCEGCATLALTNREFEILQFLAERPNSTVHRDQLIQQVWGSISPGTIRSVDRAIARLREKIEPDTKRPQYLITAYGDGYVLGLNRVTLWPQKNYRLARRFCAV